MDATLLVLIIGIFLGFFVQTVIGFAGTLIVLPILLLAMPLSEVIAFMTIFYIISSPIYIFKEWKNIDKCILKRLMLPSLIGAIIGLIILVYGHLIILKKHKGLKVQIL